MQLVHDFMIGDGRLLEVEVIGIKELVPPKIASGALAQMDPEAQGQAWGKSSKLDDSVRYLELFSQMLG